MGRRSPAEIESDYKRKLYAIHEKRARDESEPIAELWALSRMARRTAEEFDQRTQPDLYDTEPLVFTGALADKLLAIADEYEGLLKGLVESWEKRRNHPDPVDDDSEVEEREVTP